METTFENENFGNTNERPNMENTERKPMKLPAPYSGLVLTMGILSIFTFCCCSGILGIIFSIIAIVFAIVSKREVKRNSDLYDENSLGKVNAGKICAIVGLILGLVTLIIAIVVVQSFSSADILESTSAWDQMGY